MVPSLVFGPFRRPGRRLGLVLAVGLLLLLLLSGGAAAQLCPPSGADLPERVPPLPRTAGRLAAGDSLRVITLGSAATAGTGAGSSDHGYPPRLETLLRDHLPGLRVEVINRGVNGQSAAETVDRLYRDAIAADADLVIWQTGTNDALSRVDPDDFRDQLERGADWLAEAGIDLILVDPQYFPGVRNPAAYERYVAVMAEVGAARAIPVFPRHAIMRGWARDRTRVAMLSAAPFHMNDQGHACIARLLFDLILRASQP